jgi:hypothetical protein
MKERSRNAATKIYLVPKRNRALAAAQRENKINSGAPRGV